MRFLYINERRYSNESGPSRVYETGITDKNMLILKYRSDEVHSLLPDLLCIIKCARST
jgi:hypothetical protein